MFIFGKIIASLLCAKLFGWPGFLIGLWIGHLFDKGLSQNFGYYVQQDPNATKAIFFESTFAVMGHIAKADGHVTQNEINAAEQIMTRLGLTGEKREQAITAFARGKSANFNLMESLQELVSHCQRSPNLIRMFLEIQIVAATADGKTDQAELNILYQIGQVFRISQNQINKLIEMVMAQASFRQGGNGQYSHSNHQPSIEQAYKVIGVTASANKQEIKRAYRKLMSQHHPDKLVSKGMPEEMIKVATEKSQEIQSAYDMIKKHRGF